MREQIIGMFETMGVNKNQTKVYLDLLKCNISSALEISKRTGIHRSNTYDALRSLVDLGFIREIIEDKKRLFSSMDPIKIKSYLRQQQEEVDQIIPYLSEITCQKEETESVSIKKGIFAIRESLYDLLKIGKTINIFVVSEKSIDAFGEGFLKEFHKERVSKKILMTHIYDETALNKVKHLNKSDYTESKFLPKKYNSNAITIICDDVVITVIFNSHVQGIIMKNKEVSETYNKYFELLYKNAKHL